MNTNAHIPLIAMDYADRHKAVKKELLVDYANGNIYVVSADDKSIIIDITSKIKAQLENLSSDKIEVNIEGVGVVNLSKVIKEMKDKLAKQLEVTEISDARLFKRRGNRIDRVSIINDDTTFEVRGFKEAQEGMSPVKVNGVLEWMKLTPLPDPNTPEDASDGMKGDITEIEALNGKIYLKASVKQKTINLTKSVNVVLPATLDEYARIDWCLITNSYAPSLSFSNNVIWQYTNAEENQPVANNFHVYIFETWDKGLNWLGRSINYNKTEAPVSKDYVQNNFYDKSETEQIIS